MERIDSQINQDSHGASLTHVLRQEGLVLKFHILDNRVRRAGVVYRWDGAQWHEVYTLGPGAMKTRVVGGDGNPTLATFQEDLDYLLRIALEITLGI